MALTAINPERLKTPAGPYAHGIVVDPGMRWLVTTGQVALAKDGSVPDGVEAQSLLIWDHLQALLADAGMEMADIVRTAVFATSVEGLATYNAVRNQMLGELTPATTALVVSALANPKYLIEVEMIACRNP